MLEGIAASAIAPRLRHLVHLPFTAWTGLGLLSAGLMWVCIGGWGLLNHGCLGPL